MMIKTADLSVCICCYPFEVIPHAGLDHMGDDPLVFVHVLAFATGGYFMFRKFLKGMPKEDGKSDLDWQDYYRKNQPSLDRVATGSAGRVDAAGPQIIS